MILANDLPLLKYLQSILSSKLFEFAYKRLFSSCELGKSGYQYNKQALLKLPINMNATKVDCRYSDEMIFKQYNLNNEEIKYVMESFQDWLY